MSTPLVSVAVPVAVDRGFTYAVPTERAEVPASGTRVLVPFGQRALIGVVRPVAGEAPPRGRTRDLLEVLDVSTKPALAPDLVRLCEWMHDYYVAAVGEVYRLALPGLLTGVDARKVVLTELGTRVHGAGVAGPLLGRDAPSASSAERRVLEVIAEAGASGLAVARLTSVRPRIPGALRVLADLERHKWCVTSWDDAAASETRTETHVRRTEHLRGGDADEHALQRLVGRSKQRRALIDYLEGQGGDGWVSLSELRGPFPRVRRVLGRLVEAGLVVEQERPRALDPFVAEEVEPSAPQIPTSDQAEALAALEAD